MKKVLFILSFILGGFYINTYADACKGSELTKLQSIASNIKVNYEVKNEKQSVAYDPETMEREPDVDIEFEVEKLAITVYNITNDIYIVQKDDKTNEEKKIYYSDTNNGNYTFETNNITEYVNYSFEIYSNLNTCDTTLIKTINFKKPKLNPNSVYQICVENPDVPACQKYITADIGVKESELTEYVNNYINGNNGTVTTTKSSSNNNSDNNFLKDNLVYIIIVGGVIVGGSIVAYVVINKKRSAL